MSTGSTTPTQEKSEEEGSKGEIQDETQPSEENGDNEDKNTTDNMSSEKTENSEENSEEKRTEQLDNDNQETKEELKETETEDSIYNDPVPVVAVPIPAARKRIVTSATSTVKSDSPNDDGISVVDIKETIKRNEKARHKHKQLVVKPSFTGKLTLGG